MDFIDEKALVGLADLLEDEFPQVISVYRGSAPMLFNLVEQALVEADSALVRREMHGFKSNSRQIGAYGLADIAASMEEQAKNDDLTEMAAQLQQLRDDWRQIDAFLADYLMGYSASSL